MNIKLTVQGNIWISNNSRLIMVTIYCNQYRSMVCLNMMFLKQDEIVKKKVGEKMARSQKKIIKAIQIATWQAKTVYLTFQRAVLHT